MSNAKIIYDLPFEEYLALPALNQSSLKKFGDESYRDLVMQKELGTDKPTRDKNIGTALHALMLDPEDREGTFYVVPIENKRSKKDKATFQAAEADPDNQGRIIMTAPEFTRAQAMARAIKKSPLYPFFSEGKAEVTITWKDDRTGIQCKARLDWISSSHDCSIDIKKCRDITDRGISRNIAEYGYHLQDAWYFEAMKQAGIYDKPLMFCFAHDGGRNAVRWHFMHPETRRKSRIKMINLLDEFADIEQNYNRTGFAKGYLSEYEVQPIELRDYQI